MTFDLLIRGGRVIDGAGNSWYRADVGIAGDRIASVGRLAGEPAARTIDADGLFVCPGFVDMHTHSDLRLLANPAHEAKVHQGVTLEVLGQDGLSYAPVNDEVLEQLRGQLAGWNDDPPGFDWSWRTVGEYLDRLDADGIAVNAAYLAPHGTIRMCAMGYDDRAPTDDELAQMKRLLVEALEDGAVGLSTGLTYTPGMYADDDEIVALCEIVRDYGGYYTPHHRNYGSHALEAYADCIEIARRSGVPLHLAHAHLGYAINKGKAPELLAMLDRARDDGIEVTLDTYPYLAGSTYLHAFLPSWMHVGGSAATIDRLRDADLRERLRIEMEDEGCDGFHGIPMDWSIVVIGGARLPENRRYIGLSVSDAAAAAGKRPIDFTCELLADENLGVSCISHSGNEENVRMTMAHWSHTAGSDGILVGERPHPRSYGTFPRYFAVYVRELGILTWEQAVRKMTSLPAQRLGFLDRGLLRPGMAADVTCIDPETIRDTATYEDPRRLPEGVPYVLVNGTVLVDDGRHTGALAGRALRSTRRRVSSPARPAA
ncbi:MAG: D-aminoacylase [Actinobacteria bacterium]|nr:MAG: D-aminoacylase [Actinomycetota bacterium]